MKITRFSATELKRDTAKVLNLVAFGDLVAVVERYGEPLVKIIPAASPKEEINWEKKLKKYFGSIPKFPAVSKARYFRRRDLPL